MAKESVLKHSDVVFMYGADDESYRAYGTTFVGWGGASTRKDVRRHHALGVQCSGSMWCLTAGAELLYNRPDLRQAVSCDFLGEPVMPPWLFDHTYKDQKPYFGCTNHPTFRALCRQRVAETMSGGADSLHVDDHSGTGGSVYHGGGFCDHCMKGFRKFLKKHATAADLRAAGVKRADLDTFDYRDIVKRHARTRKQYIKIHARVPLDKLFWRFHFESAAAHVRQLGRAAAASAGHAVLLSANACLDYPWQDMVLGSITHVIAELGQHPALGPRGALKAIKGYDLATSRGVPMAATGMGWDWTFVKNHRTYDLVRVWIAMAYAHGQRFMCPHPTRQWCFDKKIGTHWYAAPVKEFAPVYQFIRNNADCFDGLEEISSAAVKAPPQVHVALRRDGKTGRTVLHVINLAYDRNKHRSKPQKNVRIALPASLLARGQYEVKLLSWESSEKSLPIKCRGGKGSILLPQIKNWAIVLIC
ncbi:MAG: hypothetical protein ABFD92_05990 [Planctomycetaceae bacterium]|nr:hypothetical protein [Planctomycetaceae bacterium]